MNVHYSYYTTVMDICGINSAELTVSLLIISFMLVTGLITIII